MTNAEYLAWLNRELRSDADYVDGMAFIHVPPESPIERAAGYDWIKVDGKDEVCQRIGARVLHHFEADGGRGGQNTMNPDLDDFQPWDAAKGPLRFFLGGSGGVLIEAFVTRECLTEHRLVDFKATTREQFMRSDNDSGKQRHDNVCAHPHRRLQGQPSR